MKLEELIRKKRKDFDIEKPDEDFIWTGISQNLNNKKRVVQMPVWKLVAAAVVLVAISYTVINSQLANRNSQLILVKFDPELAKQEAEMIKQINFYYDELSNVAFDESNMVTHFSDLEQIDTLISIYAKDLKSKGPDPRILNNLMDLYQKKAKILNRMLKEIEKNKRYEKNTASI